VYIAAKLTTQGKSKAKTRTEYWRWHDDYKPVGIPKFPNKVYKDEWVSWNDYLGSENTWDGYDRKFGQKFEWREFWESVKYVQGLGLGTKLEYLKLHREGGIPKDIPMAPDELPIWKGKWMGWPGYLGLSIGAKLEVIKNVERICSICESVHYASNMLEVVVCKGGLEEYGERVVRNKELRELRCYVMEEGDDKVLEGILGMCGSEQGVGVWLFVNVNEFLYECDNRLLMYRPER
jgi:hypothetical protein